MNYVTSAYIRRLIRLELIIFAIEAIACAVFGGVLWLIINQPLYFAIFSIGGIVIGAVLTLPFIIYYSHVNKKFLELLNYCEIRRGVIERFKFPIFGPGYRAVIYDGELGDTFTTHSIFVGITAFGFNRNSPAGLLGNEVDYIIDDGVIYIVSQ